MQIILTGIPDLSVKEIIEAGHLLDLEARVEAGTAIVATAIARTILPIIITVTIHLTAIRAAVITV